MSTSRTVLTRLSILLLTLFMGSSALAQDYPARPITFIVPWPAGGTTDVLGRLLATSMSEELGQPISVANRVGGGGALGTQAALDAPEDGYTVLVTTSGNHILTPLNNDVGYSYEDFVPIGQVAVRTLGLAVHPDAPWQDLDDLAEDARENPGTYTFAAVPGVLPFLTVRAWADEAGVELQHIPMEGGAPGVTGVMGGHYDMVPESAGSLVPQLEAGSLRLLAVFNEERDPALPDVPTAIEQGYDVTGNPWTGLAVAEGVPEDVVATLREALANVVEDEEFLSRAEQAGESIVYRDAEGLMDTWQREWELYDRIINGSGQ